MGLRNMQGNLLDRIADRVCSNAARKRSGDLKRLAGGDLAVLLGDIRDELEQYRAWRTAALAQCSLAA